MVCIGVECICFYLYTIIMSFSPIIIIIITNCIGVSVRHKSDFVCMSLKNLKDHCWQWIHTLVRYKGVSSANYLIQLYRYCTFSFNFSRTRVFRARDSTWNRKWESSRRNPSCTSTKERLELIVGKKKNVARKQNACWNKQVRINVLVFLLNIPSRTLLLILFTQFSLDSTRTFYTTWYCLKCDYLARIGAFSSDKQYFCLL